MMPDTLKMDVYSDRQIPFEVAAFCRGRRYLPEAVTLASKLRDREATRLKLDAAQRALDVAEAEVDLASTRVLDKMTELGER